ncbi:hypothetical protein GCK72_003359 [Caenorhabditis remanei]|uniref:Uncharacterized protein n=2 Tax=Caenorhabditis remanei TaxID=31234 RepID=A0A6A5HYT4_CAERE|nr:hypothetical protein GCK72_003359 [Caenorhabditis remanei]KAF1771532.1 hypothetical protein GCK72_003359 [Caenorhabditis remanei]
MKERSRQKKKDLIAQKKPRAESPKMEENEEEERDTSSRAATSESPEAMEQEEEVPEVAMNQDPMVAVASTSNQVASVDPAGGSFENHLLLRSVFRQGKSLK